MRKQVDKSRFKLRVYVTEIDIDIRSSFLEPIYNICSFIISLKQKSFNVL